MRRIPLLIAALMLVIAMFGITIPADDADSNPGFSNPNVTRIRFEEGSATNNPWARGAIWLKFVGLDITTDTYTSAGATITITNNADTSVTLDEAYNNSPSGNKTITVDDGAVTLANANLSTTDSYTELDVSFTKTAGATDASDNFIAGKFAASMNDADSTIGSLMGVYAPVIAASCVAVTNVYGVSTSLIINDDVSTNVQGLYSSVVQTGGTIAGNSYGLYVSHGAATVTGTSYTVYLQDVSSDYNIYQNGTAPSYLGGSLQAQGGVQSGDTDTAGRLYSWDGSGNKVGFGTPARAADLDFDFPITQAGTYDGRMTWSNANPAVATWTGDKQHLFGQYSGLFSGATYAYSGSQIYSATNGNVMMRAGTITGLSCSTSQINSGDGGALIVSVYKNGVTTGATLALSPGAGVSGYSLYSLGTYNFAAGDLLSIYLDGSTLLGGIVVDVIVDCEYQTR